MHNSTGDNVTVARSVPFTSERTLREPWNDMDCTAETPQGTGQFQLSRYFPMGVGPHKFAMTNDDFERLAIHFEAQLKAQQSNAERGAVKEVAAVATSETLEKKRASLAVVREKARLKRQKLEIEIATGAFVQRSTNMLALPAPTPLFQLPAPVVEDEESDTCLADTVPDATLS